MLSTFNGILAAKNFSVGTAKAWGSAYVLGLNCMVIVVVDINQQIEIMIMKYMSKDLKSCSHVAAQTGNIVGNFNDFHFFLATRLKENKIL